MKTLFQKHIELQWFVSMTLVFIASSPSWRVIAGEKATLPAESQSELRVLREQLAEQTKRIDRLYDAFGPQLQEMEERAAGLRKQAEEDQRLKLETNCIISGRRFTCEARFSPTGESFAVVTRGGSLLILSVDGKDLRELKLPGENIKAFAYGLDGKQLLIGTRSGKVLLWDIATGKSNQIFAGLARPICHVLWLPKPERCVVAYDQAVGEYAGFVIRLSDGVCLTNFSSHWHICNYQAVAASADGKWIGVLDVPGNERAGYLLDSERCEIKAKLRDEEYPSGPLSISIAPDNNTVAVGYGPFNLSLWDGAGQKELRLVQAHQNWVTSLAFSPDSKRLISGAGDSTARIWEVATGKEIGRVRFEGESTYVNSVGFSSDGKLILAAAENDVLVVAKAPQLEGFP